MRIPRCQLGLAWLEETIMKWHTCIARRIWLYVVALPGILLYVVYGLRGEGGTEAERASKFFLWLFRGRETCPWSGGVLLDRTRNV